MNQTEQNWLRRRINCSIFKTVNLGLQIKVMENLLDRITLDPDILFGKPSIRGLRYSVAMILDLLSAGMRPEEIVEDYPDLEIADIQACLVFAARLVEVGSVMKVKAA